MRLTLAMLLGVLVASPGGPGSYADIDVGVPFSFSWKGAYHPVRDKPFYAQLRIYEDTRDSTRHEYAYSKSDVDAVMRVVVHSVSETARFGEYELAAFQSEGRRVLSCDLRDKVNRPAPLDVAEAFRAAVWRDAGDSLRTFYKSRQHLFRAAAAESIADTVDVNWQANIIENRPRVLQFAQSIHNQARDYWEHWAADRAALLSLVDQPGCIRAEAMPDSDRYSDPLHRNGYRSPIEVIWERRGDCDGIACLVAALWATEEEIVCVYLPEAPTRMIDPLKEAYPNILNDSTVREKRLLPHMLLGVLADAAPGGETVRRPEFWARAEGIQPIVKKLVLYDPTSRRACDPLRPIIASRLDFPGQLKPRIVARIRATTK